MVLHEGQAEMKDGRRQDLVTLRLPQCPYGRGVHVVTVNDYWLVVMLSGWVKSIVPRSFCWSDSAGYASR